MTSKERFLITMQNGKADRVPCTPDISNYIPCKRTKLPFWDIYFNEEIPLWQAYCDAASYYDIDMWLASSTSIPFLYSDDHVTIQENLSYDEQKDAMWRNTSYHTPDGTLEHTEICFRNEPPTHYRRIIQNPENDWDAFYWLQREPVAIDQKKFQSIKHVCQEREQAFGLTLGYPGFHMWEGMIEGGITTLSYLYMDNPSYLDRWFELDMERGTQAMELYLAEQPDYVLFGGSGTLTMSSLELVMRYSIPALKKWSEMAHKAHVPCMVHSCGKSRLLVDLLVEHTSIDCINPLEMPPMGDVDLKEIHAVHGKHLALMGNLHTINTMLYAKPEEVYSAAQQAIEIAGEDGGFILSTGDQCPIDTPDENLFALVAAAKEKGKYL